MTEFSVDMTYFVISSEELPSREIFFLMRFLHFGRHDSAFGRHDSETMLNIVFIVERDFNFDLITFPKHDKIIQLWKSYQRSV